ncbi:MAG: multicopper oxidase domain-containing protein [Gemmatimonadaceae bacterium]|nr:multicopper oxidase domain-containing protein [Gemmatimonadaceae bacterium]
MRSGTEVRVAVRNALTETIWVRGLQDRARGTIDSTEIEPGATQQFRFRALSVGAWYYWAGASGRTTAQYPMSTDDGELLGALIVEADSISHDRVFVMTRWTPRGLPGNTEYQLNAINGRSWPHTERLEYTVGDSLRWHVINASDDLHMMHLHGFYYRVDNRGDAAHDSSLARTRKASVVTVATRRGEWMSITWSPDRVGNWLFHCHFVAHMSAAQRVASLDTQQPSGATDTTPMSNMLMHDAATSDMTMGDMGGLLLGVTVKPRRGAPPVAAATKPSRELQLFADMRQRVYGEAPGYGFVLQDGAAPPARDSIRIPGTPLVLTRGDPVAITVHNRTTAPMAVHWHGIELESYYDGVAGWSGVAKRLAPIIAPDASFVAAFTPPRAGTFMYHVHNEAGDELASGLYAPLIVLEPGATFDQQRDRIIVISNAGPGLHAATAINGKLTPDTMEFVAGETYRLRVIDIASNEAHVIALKGPTGVASWRQLARDGQDLPAEQQAMQPARMVAAAGITVDFEFTPPAAGEYAFEVTTIVSSAPAGATLAPIRVRAP